MQHLVPLLTATTLTQLHLRGANSCSASNEIFQRLGQCQLRDLRLHCRPRPQWASGLAALSSLTELTALHLYGWDCLGGPADWRALAAMHMSCLQALCLGGVDTYDAIEVPEAAIASLHALSALTALSIITYADLNDMLVEGLAAQPLPALQELRLGLTAAFEMVGRLARCVAALPALRRLHVDLHRVSSADIDDEGNSLDADTDVELDNCAMANFSATQNRLSRAAASAGVELSMKQHAPK